MTKNFKLVLALALSIMMVLGSVALADVDSTAPYVDNSHTVVIETHGYAQHTYGAYQIFKGNLDAKEGVLSNIVWGSEMTSAAIIELKTAVAADVTIAADFTEAFAKTDAIEQARAVAAVLGTDDYKGNNATKTQAFADALDKALKTKSTVTAITDATTKKATFTLPADGYYFFRDDVNLATTDTKDTYSRFMLQVVNDLSIMAKDTTLTPDKVILKEDGEAVNGGDGVKENDSSIGDVINFKVTIPVPDTKLYKDHFIMNMCDTLDAGLTYLGNMSITIGTKTLTETTNYTTTVTNADNSAFTLLTGDNAAETAISTTGGQKIKVVFNGFKKYVEDNNLIGQTITLTYDAVLNKNATMNEIPNKNEVYFIYSNNPNHDYDDDEPGPQEPTGETPHSKTKTFVTKLRLLKVDAADNHALPGAVFKIKGTSWNHVLETGEKFVESTYTAKEGETIQTGTYYKLKDGSYTTTVPVTDGSNLDTSAQYESTTTTYKLVKYTQVVTKKGKNFESEVITDNDGYITIEGIEQGTYTITETLAPDGYNLDATQHTLKLDWTAPNWTEAEKKSGFSIDTTTSDANWSYNGTEGLYKLTITNAQGATLPSTGGIGTTIFYVAGSIMVLAAAILLITKRRMGAND